MTLTLKSLPKVKILQTQIKEYLSKYARIVYTGHNLLLASKIKVKVKQKGHIHLGLIGYNFTSICHRDFKLGSYF